MSKLSDLIRHATRAEPAPIGFATSAHKPAATMLLVALAGDHPARAAAEAVSAGVDAVLLTGRPNEKDLKEAVAAAQGKPCGAEAAADQLEVLRSAGIDFAVLDLQAQASALQEEELALVLRLREELTDFQLRALEALSFDALYLERDAGAPTILHYIEFQRAGGLARKPLLLPVRQPLPQQELLSLRDAGVVLLGVDFGERGAADTLRRLREAIDALPRRKPRKRGESAISLLKLGSTPPAEEEEDEDEDEEPNEE